jgi:ATP-binding cassette subfamily B (MDR/TAP) protein 1
MNVISFEFSLTLDFPLPQLERSVQDALEKIRRERKLTTVTVAHRLSTIIHSDKIVVIADGVIQETGTHRELIKKGGIYSTLCKGQGLTVEDQDQNQSETEQINTTGPLAEDGIERSKDIEQAIEESEDIGKEDKYLLPDTTGVRSRLFQYTYKDIGYSIIGYAGAIIVGALPACEGILFGMITGNFFMVEDAEVMRGKGYELSLWFLLLSALSFVGNSCMGVGCGVSGSRLTRRLRVLVFEKLMRYPISWFDRPEHSTGELTTSLEEDSQMVSNVSGMSQGQCIQLYACLAAGLIVTLIYSWQVGLTAIACVPLILGSNIIQARFASREPSNDSLISPATLLERSFANIVVLQAVSQRVDLLTVLSLSIMELRLTFLHLSFRACSMDCKMMFHASIQVHLSLMLSSRKSKQVSMVLPLVCLNLQCSGRLLWCFGWVSS